MVEQDDNAAVASGVPQKGNEGEPDVGVLRERNRPMVGYMSLDEQVDKDFSLAPRKALLGRVGAWLRRDSVSDGLLCFDDLRKVPGANVRGSLNARPGSYVREGVSRALFVGHYGMSLAAKRTDARLSSGRLMVAVRELPEIFRGDIRGGFLVGSEADGIVAISTPSRAALSRKRPWRRRRDEEAPYYRLTSGG
jgi:hypothetical protein